MRDARWPIRFLALLICAACAVPIASAATSDSRTDERQLSDQDRQFLYWANDMGMADAALSRLAEQKTENSAVKDLARRFLEQEKRNRAALNTLAQAHRLSLPREPVKEDRDLHDNLAATRDGEFDHLFMRKMVADIRKTIDLYDQQARTGRAPDVESFVAEALPRLRQLDDRARHADLQLPGTAPLMSPSGTISDHRPSPGPM